MSSKETKLRAKEILKGNWELGILACLLYVAGIIVASIFSLGIGGTIVSGPLFLGVLFIYDQFIHREEAEWKDIFIPFKERFADSCIVGIIFSLVAIGPIALIIVSLILSGFAALTFVLSGQGFGGGFAAMGFGFLLTVAVLIAVFIFSYAISEAYYILMAEDDIKGIDAMKLSIKVTKGHKLSLFKLDLSFIGWFILVFITGIAGLYVVPYYITSRLLLLEEIYSTSGAYVGINQPSRDTGDIDDFLAQLDGEDNNNKFENVNVDDTVVMDAPIENVCKSCGAPLAEGGTFCGKCGTKQ